MDSILPQMAEFVKHLTAMLVRQGTGTRLFYGWSGGENATHYAISIHEGQ